jgi:hypothetical protein
LQDDHLERLLRSLPREGAQPGFGNRVLRRLEDRELDHRTRRPVAVPALALSAAVVAALLAALIVPRGSDLMAPRRSEPLNPPLAANPGSRSLGPAPVGRASAAPAARLDRSQARQLLHQLRHEGAALEHELAGLRRSDDSVIYLGGDDDLDMVIDLKRVPEVRRTAGPPHFHM